MPSQPLSISFRGRVTQFLRTEGTWVWIAGIILATVVFLTQNRVVGLEPGYNELQPGHHGWVTSHTLAIISHATPENRFVGYALALADEQGHVDYDYFDRTPVFFSAGMHILLSFWERISTKIYLAKQAMNAIFLLTVLASFGLVRTLTGRTLLAVAVSILAVSSRYLLFYKDMVHFDQPALMGTVLLVFGIAQHTIRGRRWAAYLAAFVAVSFGGLAFAPLFVILVWLLIEVGLSLGQAGPGIRAKAGKIWRLDSLRVLGLSAGWALVNLAYNAQAEMAKRGVSLAETSIVQSAVNRLALNPAFNESYQRLLNWNYFVSDEVIRAVRWIFPIWNYEGSAGLSVLIVFAIGVTIVLYGRSVDRSRRVVLAVLTLSGPIWLFVMRNLSAFHDYTAMFYLGMGLAFYAALLSLLRLPRAAWVAVIFLCLAVFTERNLSTQAWHVTIGRPLNAYTHDFMRISAALPGPGYFIYYRDDVPYAPYAAGFYLPDQYIAPPQAADFVVAGDPGYADELLTPGNSRRFLFAMP